MFNFFIPNGISTHIIHIPQKATPPRKPRNYTHCNRPHSHALLPCLRIKDNHCRLAGDSKVCPWRNRNADERKKRKHGCVLQRENEMRSIEGESRRLSGGGLSKQRRRFSGGRDTAI
ncbi:unnamed protein product [Vicia faba]|uniref:Uncharacterized protein n=1 Tax=Vicia faba TaxID=3906 RepID=A0AAV0ZV26_VICFA|nr:unnamed protein product [Vicia faba]